MGPPIYDSSRPSSIVSNPSSCTYLKKEVYDPFLPFLEEEEVSLDWDEPYFYTSYKEYYEVFIEEIIPTEKYIEDMVDEEVMVISFSSSAICEEWINQFATKFDDEAPQDVDHVSIDDDHHM